MLCPLQRYQVVSKASAALSARGLTGAQGRVGPLAANSGSWSDRTCFGGRGSTLRRFTTGPLDRSHQVSSARSLAAPTAHSPSNSPDTRLALPPTLLGRPRRMPPTPCSTRSRFTLRRNTAPIPTDDSPPCRGWAAVTWWTENISR
jgi:hypothetical protein